MTAVQVKRKRQAGSGPNARKAIVPVDRRQSVPLSLSAKLVPKNFHEIVDFISLGACSSKLGLIQSLFSCDEKIVMRRNLVVAAQPFSVAECVHAVANCDLKRITRQLDTLSLGIEGERTFTDQNESRKKQDVRAHSFPSNVHSAGMVA